VLPLTTAVNCLTTSPSAPFGALGSFPSKEIERLAMPPRQRARGLSFTTIAANIAKLPEPGDNGPVLMSALLRF
jgi:hypothetical protein